MRIINCYDGKEHIYKYPCTLPVTSQGNAKARGKSPLDIVRDDIADFLGERKYTRVKLFVGRTGRNVRIA